MIRITGQLVDIFAEKIFPAEVVLADGKVQSITPLKPGDEGYSQQSPYILPGFIDAHVHIESSLLIPSEFARMATIHGTIATVSDPHEIANVCGLPGVEFMIRNGNTVPFYFNFGAPSCVPATIFETAGAALSAVKVKELLQRNEIKYLSEMMNFPGVLNHDQEVMSKIAAARDLGKPVDGHAPGILGEQAKQYIDAGISTDHECVTAEEALDKLKYGMKILIREGSAARNFDALAPLLNDHSDQMMLCSDDKHPDSLLLGHIDQLCARAIAKGIPLFNVLKAACLNPVLHYKLDSGLLRVGDPADCIMVEDLKEFKVLKTFVKGQLVAENGNPRIASTHLVPSAPPLGGPSMLEADPINNFNAAPRTVADFAYPLDKWGEQENVEQVYVIEALDGQLITNKLIAPVVEVNPNDGLLESNVEKDILKIVVVNRYGPAPVAKSFVKNFGLKRGAIASSVAHDSHNIVAVGVDDESICKAVNLIIAQKGGLACVDPGAEVKELILPLPVGGLMSLNDGFAVAEAYTAIDHMAKELGSKLRAPFMTLSFMALLVIPHLKLGDLGLFDGDGFRLV
ncbi:adenine deaminase [Flavitalea sp. BT771]|uniref:adenine deaminase n=1 Tax=Flavitalea sp. BT771 TaxID=3063329 RepID=UPI0026E2F2E6|nr:adenine deaminase [Flavitalea sp. BT771]MDO6433010.1 adenine deaminase [Flavitalea sp. BT771]MDV6221714.1 adenine deaminase [Flavitalea sp. BT771]